MENRKLYALVLGALAVAAAIGSVATVSFAAAQPQEKGNKEPMINGTINAGNEIMSKVKVDFVNATSTAGKAAKGHVIGGDLTIENGYVVYSFWVISGNVEKNVIVDAGSGKVLYTSEGFPADLLSEMSDSECDQEYYSLPQAMASATSSSHLSSK
jgi:uncharacterized membrane protein YkoI